MGGKNKIKRILGIAWMLMGPAMIAVLFISAIKSIYGTAKGDIANPIPWIIIIGIFTPIAIGLTIFGWYSWKGEYDELV
jgi:hypothetical protein